VENTPFVSREVIRWRIKILLLTALWVLQMPEGHIEADQYHDTWMKGEGLGPLPFLRSRT
jgi:hypothetical protein